VSYRPTSRKLLSRRFKEVEDKSAASLFKRTNFQTSLLGRDALSCVKSVAGRRILYAVRVYRAGGISKYRANAAVNMLA